MTQTNFRASDFKRNETKGTGFAVRSTRDRITPIEEPKPEPSSQPVIAPGASADDVPQGTVTEVLTWVGDDKDRAQKALDKEKENAKPRKGLLSSLDEILRTYPDDEAGS